MDDVRSTLERKLAEIDAESGAMAAPPTDTANISFGKRVGDGTQMAVDRLAQVAVHDQLQATRLDVVRALEKVEDDTYGTCDTCGEAIPERRLEVLPWAVRCVKDAAAASSR